jgi:hypothetical protein
MTVYDIADSNLFYSRNVRFIIRYADTTTLETGMWLSIRNGAYADYPVDSFTWNSKNNTVVINLE